MKKTTKIAIYVCRGFEPLDLFGPHTAFMVANEMLNALYDVSIVSKNAGFVTTETGIEIGINTNLEDIEQVHTLILVGGSGPRTYRLSKSEKSLLDSLAGNAVRVASVCTGAFLLAQLSVAQNRRIATHWRHADELKKSYPAINVTGNEIYTQDGHIWSSGGVTAGLDMTLKMILDDCGSAIASAVARQLLIYLKRPGDQAQFSEPLRAQAIRSGRLGDVVRWIFDNLDKHIDTEMLAAQAHLSTRHFSRLFREEFGQSPSKFIERLRLDRARIILAEGEAHIGDVARAVGYQSDDVFRRAFERYFAVPPSVYQRQFSMSEDG
jgi:transcriptional regulator GlxA family with amidase domain